MNDIEQGLSKPIVQNQLQLIRLRNTSTAFNGKLEVIATNAHRLHLKWENNGSTAILKADLRDHSFSVFHKDAAGEESVLLYP